MIETLAQMWHNFHFIRPLWLLALIPALGLLWWLARGAAAPGAWSRVVDAHLLPHLLHSTGQRAGLAMVYILGAAWLLAVLALAGPSWSKLPQAVYRAQNARVLVLSLAPTMDARDVAPSRLARARLKVLDVLARQGEGQVALIAYAGEPYVVAPLTEDAKTIAALVPVLTTDVMPVAGDQLSAALHKAGELLAQAGVPQGEVIVIADSAGDVPAGDDAAQLRAAGHRVSVLAVGTSDGVPVTAPGRGYLKDAAGAIIIAKLELQPLQQLARTGGGRFAQLGSDDSDLEQLLGAPPATRATDHARRVDGSSERWRDQGPWLVLILLPLVALLFRRGWWVAGLAALLIVPPQPAYAFEWSDLWSRPDQQAQRALQQQDYARAAELFEDAQRKGAAFYRAQRYDDAAQAFAQERSADAYYNHGNALAKAGQLQQAQAAYQEALRLLPDHEDARFNNALVEKMLESQPPPPSKSTAENQQQDAQRQNSPPSPGEESAQAPPPQQPNEDGAGRDKKSESNQAGKAAAPPQQPDKPPEQKSAAGKPSEPPENKEGQAQQQAAAARDASKREAEQAMEQWLGRVDDDPGGLLREKFRREHLRRLQRGAKP